MLLTKIIEFFYRKLNKSNNTSILRAKNLSKLKTSKSNDYIYYDSHKKTGANFIFKKNDSITRRYFEEGEYDESIVIKGLKILKKEKITTLINFGGHVGTSIIPLIKKSYFSLGIAFEPSINNYKLLETNILINGLENKITTYNSAIGTKVSVGKIFEGEKNNTGDFRVYDEKKHSDNENRIQQISIVPLDDYWLPELNNNCLLLVDVQGYELEALKGTSKFIKNKIPTIMELCPYLLKEDSNLEMFLLLKNYDYIVDLEFDEVYDFNEKNFNSIYSKYVYKNIPKNLNWHTNILFY
jgi:FkbM family methyltransferase